LSENISPSKINIDTILSLQQTIVSLWNSGVTYVTKLAHFDNKVKNKLLKL